MRPVPALTCLVAMVAIALPVPISAQRVRLDVPVVIHADDLDPCSNGVVTGLDPRGDGFLAVKSGPGLGYRRIDKLFNGEKIWVCGSRGDWLAIVYSRGGRDCNVASPWPRTLPYTGPCQPGWAYRRWVAVYAG